MCLIQYTYKYSNTIFSNFFLEIQLSLHQFLFEFSRISTHGEILKKLCAIRHASTRISQKSCFRLKQKYPLANFCVELFSCLASEHSWWIYVKIHVKVHFTIASQILRSRKSGILCSHKFGIIFTRLHTTIWWRKNRYVECFFTDIIDMCTIISALS